MTQIGMTALPAWRYSGPQNHL